MNPTALARLRSVLQTHVDQGLLPGAVALIHHRGHTVLHTAVGHQRPPGAESAVPAMAPDTLFRIYSMTKPIASLVAMMLMEEGRLLLSHPVAHYLPAFAGQRVYDEATGTTAPVQREATVHDLLRHTAGLSYAWEAGTVPDAYRAARVGSRRHSNADLVAALGPLPLVHQPGTRWEYSRATDVLGAVLEVIEGESLGAILQRRVFGPLGMHDTGFSVPAAQQHRLAEAFERDPQTGIGMPLIDVTAPPVFESAGGGLVSTASDYARFLQLMLGRGTAPGQDGPSGTSGNDGLHDRRPPGQPARGGRHPAHRLRLWPGRGRAHRHGPGHPPRIGRALQLERPGRHLLFCGPCGRPVRHPAHAGARPAAVSVRAVSGAGVRRTVIRTPP